MWQHWYKEHVVLWRTEKNREFQSFKDLTGELGLTGDEWVSIWAFPEGSPTHKKTFQFIFLSFSELSYI